jgi:hypothetical protein
MIFSEETIMYRGKDRETDRENQKEYRISSGEKSD